MVGSGLNGINGCHNIYFCRRTRTKIDLFSDGNNLLNFKNISRIQRIVYASLNHCPSLSNDFPVLEVRLP